MGAYVIMRQRGLTVTQEEVYGLAGNWRGPHGGKVISHLCADLTKMLKKIIEYNLQTEETTYIHSKLDGPLFDRIFADKTFKNINAYENVLYDEIGIEVLNAFMLHDAPCNSDHDWSADAQECRRRRAGRDD